MADRFAEIMEQLGLDVAAALRPPLNTQGQWNEPGVGVQPQLAPQAQPMVGATPPGGPSQVSFGATPPARVNPYPAGSTMANMWDVQNPGAQPAPRQLQASPPVALPPNPPQIATAPSGGVPFPNTQSGGPMPQGDWQQEGSVNPLSPPAGGATPLPVGNPPADLLAYLGITPRPEAPSISTVQMSGYEPTGTNGPSAGAPPPEASRQGGYGPAWQRPAGAGGTGGGQPPSGPPGGGVTAASSPPSAAPSPQAQAPTAPPQAQSPMPSAQGDRFGISPRVYQLMGVIGATLMSGQRPGENPAALMGRALGAGMMYDNFARVSDQERADTERTMRMKEKQFGLAERKQGVDEVQVRAQIENIRRRLALAERADEREALEHQLSVLMKSIGLKYAPAMAEADLKAKQSAVETPAIRRERILADVLKSSKDIDGNFNIAAYRKAKAALGYGADRPPAGIINSGNERLKQFQGAEQARQRSLMNEKLVRDGYEPVF